MKTSIIIRTYNEEKWISRCLCKVLSQRIESDVEVIVVDSGSSDKTVQKALLHGAKIVTVPVYKPGLSLNAGVRESTGSILVFLSAHCIPVNDEWLSRLTKPLLEGHSRLVGAYGRQLPTPSSDAADIRDLLITFGNEDRLQTKDTFFHNANSTILRSAWEKVEFDESASNIEDRLWAERVISMGYNLKYCADAAVYHWHGIHQYGDLSRLKGTIDILKNRTQIYRSVTSYYPVKQKWMAFVLRVHPLSQFDARMLKKVADVLKQTSFDWTIVICTPDSAPKHNEELCFDYSYISRDGTDTSSFVDSLRYCIEQYEDNSGEIVESFAVFNLDYISRDPSDIEDMISYFLTYDCDLLVPRYTESKPSDSCFHEYLPITDTDSLFNGLHRDFSSDYGTVIPGYCILSNASLIRSSGCNHRVSLARFPVLGQEKLIKISSESEFYRLKLAFGI